MSAQVNNITGFTGRVLIQEDTTANAVSVSYTKRNY